MKKIENEQINNENKLTDLVSPDIKKKIEIKINIFNR